MNTDEVRKRFESWLINEQGYSKNDVARHNGARVYLVPQVHTMWLAYQQGIKDSEDKWISVDNRLPEDKDLVAVRLEHMNGDISFSTCAYHGFFPFKAIDWRKSDSKDPVTHWLPLPALKEANHE